MQAEQKRETVWNRWNDKVDKTNIYWLGLQLYNGFGLKSNDYHAVHVLPGKVLNFTALNGIIIKYT